MKNLIFITCCALALSCCTGEESFVQEIQTLEASEFTKDGMTDSVAENINETISDKLGEESSNVQLLNNVDFENQDYSSVKIGNAEWMIQNLNLAYFRNGDPIPQAKTDAEWISAGENEQPAWCYYENDPENGKIYGKLYNYYAVNDSRGLAPEGWRIPDIFDILDFDKEEGVTVVYDEDHQVKKLDIPGKIVKSTSGWYVKKDIPCSNCANWNQEYRSKVPCHSCKDTRVSGRIKKIPKNNGTNSVGFTALPGGYRTHRGDFKGDGGLGRWWILGVLQSDSRGEKKMTQFWELAYFPESQFDGSEEYLGCGMSVRCKKD